MWRRIRREEYLKNKKDMDMKNRMKKKKKKKIALVESDVVCV